MAKHFMFTFWINIMNNISFKANLIVNKNLYTKMPEGTPTNYTDNLVNEYKKFLDHRVIKEVTEGDTIEIYKAPYNKGFALGMRYTSDKLKEPIESGIYTNKKIPEVKAGSLIFQTMQFLIAKSDIELKFFEPHFKTFERALRKLYNKDSE